MTPGTITLHHPRPGIIVGPSHLSEITVTILLAVIMMSSGGDHLQIAMVGLHLTTAAILTHTVATVPRLLRHILMIVTTGGMIPSTLTRHPLCSVLALRPDIGTSMIDQLHVTLQTIVAVHLVPQCATLNILGV